MSENEPAIIRSVREYVDGLPERFVPEAAAGVTAVYQWEISGEGGATFHAEVVDGACTVSLGAHDSPAVTLCMDAEDWVRLVNGELDGMMAFTNGVGQVKLERHGKEFLEEIAGVAAPEAQEEPAA